MRRLLLIAVTTAATVAIGGTALAASGPGRSDDDNPSHVVVDDRPSHDVGDDHGTHSPSPSVSASIDDRPSHDVGDDHGGLRDGHGRDDRAGDDHGGSRHRH
ncbi:MAG TPA: hypothetical protein VL738_25760 [Dactylosporangium sp.]|jgi:hypothetical protein|nr:hypothetical protein [Dactylosporangium sp.]